MADSDVIPWGEFRKIADSLPTLCWVADVTGYIVWYNQQWHDYCGTTPEEMQGWGWTQVHDPEALPAVMDEWKRSIATGEPFEQTFPIRGADGVFRSFLTRVVPITSELHEFRWLGINIDVSEQLRIEQELRESEGRLLLLNETLEARVEERADALKKTEDQLRQSQKMEAVGQLTGGLAHDFNNLLTGIKGNLEIIQMRISDSRFDGIDRFINNAQMASNRAAALTQRLLAFSRRQTLDPKPTRVSDLISGMENLIRSTIGPSVALKIGNLEDTVICVDAPQLENSLLNLCINSRDALPGGGTITIDVNEVEISLTKSKSFDIKPGRYLKIKVIDDGCGMDKTVISKAFDPFFTTKPIGQGTGLGLSMIYGFSRQSKGHITIESATGCGATICIFLPLPVGEELTLPDSTPDTTPAILPGNKGNILFVDDEVMIRLLGIEVLEDAGYHVLDAADGIEAMKILESDAQLDLLITDVGLPNGMNGRQVADAARACRPGLKVLLITGYAEQTVMTEVLGEAVELLTKPFVLTELVERATSLISSGESHGRSTPTSPSG